MPLVAARASLRRRSPLPSPLAHVGDESGDGGAVGLAPVVGPRRAVAPLKLALPRETLLAVRVSATPPRKGSGSPRRGAPGAAQFPSSDALRSVVPETRGAYRDKLGCSENNH